MTKQAESLKKVYDPNFLVHRYIETQDAFRFLKVSREIHRQSTFITDEYLPKNLEHFDISRTGIAEKDIPTSPIHFIFHSAYCCSTMLARAFDIQGKSMGLKEPVILNDLVGWRRRGADYEHLKEVLKQSLTLLSKSFSSGEATIIKPSNTCNILAFDILKAYPEAKALLLYAPIESYLQSIVKKEMWGRIWVRTALIGQLKDKSLVGGYSIEEILQLTDLQVAALGWLSQHALFLNIIKTFGDTRVKLLDSDTFLSRQFDSLSALSKLYDIRMTQSQTEKVLTGPAFTQHSKDGRSFDAKARTKEQQNVSQLHSAEIDMVSGWMKEVAKSQNIKLNTKNANLLDCR